MSADGSNDGDPFSINFEESVKRVREEFDKLRKEYDKKMERQKERWEETGEKMKENLKDYSLFDPIEPDDVVSSLDPYDFGSGRKRYRVRVRRNKKNHSERERFYDFVDNDLDMSEFKRYVD